MCNYDVSNTVVLTGGKPEGSAFNFKRAIRYNRNGDATDLPDMNEGRIYHGCSGFVNADNEMVNKTLQFWSIQCSFMCFLGVSGNRWIWNYFWIYR